MRSLALALLVFALVACDKKKPPAAPPANNNQQQQPDKPKIKAPASVPQSLVDRVQREWPVIEETA